MTISPLAHRTANTGRFALLALVFGVLPAVGGVATLIATPAPGTNAGVAGHGLGGPGVGGARAWNP